MCSASIENAASSLRDEFAARFQKAVQGTRSQIKEGAYYVWSRKVFQKLAVGMGWQTSVIEIWREHDNFEEVYKEMEAPASQFYLYVPVVPKNFLLEHLCKDTIKDTELWKFFLKVLQEKDGTPTIVFRTRSGALWVLTLWGSRRAQRLHPRIVVGGSEGSRDVQIMTLDLFMKENGDGGCGADA